MSELRAKLNQLDSQNLQNNDALYSLLEEIIDKIEEIEKQLAQSKHN